MNNRLPIEERLGQVGYNNKGYKMTIINYVNYDNIDIQFEDGSITYHKGYGSFLNGKIAYPRKNRIGETNISNQGYKMTIIEYRREDDIDIQFEDGTVIKHRKYGDFKRGKVKYPIVYGEINGNISKICIKCNQEKILDDFTRNGDCNICKECASKYSKQYRENNKEYLRESKKQYYYDNPHKAFNHRNKRREKEENQGLGITKEQWYEMMEFFNWSCAYSGEYIGGKSNNQRTIDHIVPLNNNGLNEIWNCVPMLKSYNTSKYTNYMIDWYKKQDFYSDERLNKIFEWQMYAYKKWS